MTCKKSLSYLLSWLSNLIYQAIAPLLCGGIIEQLSPTQSPTLTNPYPVKQDQAIKCTFPPCDSVCFSMPKYLISHHFCDFFLNFTWLVGKPKKIQSTLLSNKEDHYKYFHIYTRKTVFNSNSGPCWLFCVTKSKVKSLGKRITCE